MPKGADRILITGATGPIGRAVAKALAGPSARVTLSYLSSRNGVEALQSELRDTCEAVHIVRSDLSLPDGPAALVDEAAGAMGGLSLAVHCAAIFERTPFGEVGIEQWERIIATDLRAPFFLAQAAAKKMRGGPGSLIFISDVAASRPYGDYLPYSIAKAGVEALVRGLARRLAPAVRVNAIAPFAVTRHEGVNDAEWTEILKRSPMGKPTSPEEVAAAVKWLAESETTTGQVVALDGGRTLR